MKTIVIGILGVVVAAMLSADAHHRTPNVTI